MSRYIPDWGGERQLNGLTPQQLHALIMQSLTFQRKMVPFSALAVAQTRLATRQEKKRHRGFGCSTVTGVAFTGK